MNKFLIATSMILSIVVVLESVFIFHQQAWLLDLQAAIRGKQVSQIIPPPLLAYTFTNLQKTKFPLTKITLGSVVSNNQTYRTQTFYYSVPITPKNNTLETVSGLMNMPSQPGKYPLIVMFRGYVPENMYNPGIGTEPVAQVLAERGFITLAPDFLGYGTSASPASDPFENRFQTYTTALTLLSSLSSLNAGLSASYSGTFSVDMSKIGIWGHSNGGNITLSTLAISGTKYPTVLWAPVSTAFPYDILYYTDESDDQGKSLRQILAQFEQIYNTDLFSPPNYYSWIKAPIEIDQGTADHEVPVWWSDNLVSILKKDNVQVTYNTYEGADHNLLPTGWSNAVNNDIQFYNQQFAQ